MRTPRLGRILGPVVVAAVLAGCGGGGDDGSVVASPDPVSGFPATESQPDGSPAPTTLPGTPASPTAPGQEPEPTPEPASASGTGYAAILGRHFDEPVVTSFVGDNGCQPTGLHYVCKRAGIELSFDTGRRLRSVLLYPAGSDGFDQYRDTLPGGLTWSDTRSDVERKLGTPAVLQPGAPPVRAFAVYHDPSVIITYATTAAPTADSAMHHLEVKS